MKDVINCIIDGIIKETIEANKKEIKKENTISDGLQKAIDKTRRTGSLYDLFEIEEEMIKTFES